MVGRRDTVGAGRGLVVLGARFVGPAGAGGRGKPESANIVAIFLTLGDVDSVPVGDRLEQVGKAIKNPANAIEVPNPALSSCARTSLSKILRLKSDDLVQQLSILIVVGVVRHLGA